MFCPNCGTHLPDGSAFCATCGSALSQPGAAPVNTEPAAPVYTAPTPPVYADPNPPVYNNPTPPVYGNPYNTPVVAKDKKVWLSTLASPKAKKMSKLSLIFTAACALVLILALCTSIFGPVYNIPVIKMALGEDYVNQVNDLKDLLSEADDELEWFEDRYADELEDADVDKAFKVTKNFIKNPSLGNCRAWANVMGDNEIGGIFDVFITFLWIAFGLVILLAVLGGLLKKAGLVIAAIVVSVPVNLLFGGVVFLILCIAAMGILTYTLMQISGEYKAYKQNPGNVYIA